MGYAPITLRMLTGDQLLNMDVRRFSEHTLAIAQGKIVKSAMKIETLNRWAIKNGYEFKPVKGWLFLGYYRKLSTDEYLYIV